MSVIITIALALVLVLAVYQAARLVLAASRAGSGNLHRHEDIRIVHLRDERERSLASLKEMEVDLEMGKLSREDYDELRSWYEQRAVEAIRALRDLEKGTGAVLAAVLAMAVVLGGGSVHAQEMPPGHPPIDGAGGMGGATGDSLPANTDATVRVIHTDATGATGPRAGVRVLVEAMEAQRPGMNDDPAVLAVWTALTGADGVAQLGRLKVPSGANLQVMVVDGALRYPARTRTGAEWVVRTYDTTTEIDALSMDGRIDMAVEEGSLTVRLTWTFVNESSVAVDLAARERPVFLPLLAPAAMGSVISHGFMPPQATKHVRMSASPDMGRISVEEGGFAYRGLVLPGESMTVRIGYPLDYPADDMSIGVRAEVVPVRTLLLTLTRASRLNPEMRVSVPVVGADSDQGQDRMLMVKAIDPLDVGAEVTLNVRNLPVHGRIGRWTATGLMSVGALVLVIAFLRSRAVARMEPSA